MIGTFDVTSSALVAQRTRLDVIAGNIANAEVTRQEDGTVSPYRRRFVTLMSGDGQGGPGVHVDELCEDRSPPRMEYAPEHPDRIREGPWKNFVQMPNVKCQIRSAGA